MLHAPIATPTREQLGDPMLLSDVQARIAWSTIIEPGDEALSEWASYLGSHQAALWTLINNRTPDVMVTADKPDPFTENALETFKRWRPQVQQDLALLRVAIGAINRLKIRVIVPGHPHWPAVQMARLGARAPVALYVRGDSAMLVDEKKITLCGARAATGYGEFAATTLAAGLTERGVTIISGAAFGIDAQCHRTVLAAEGRTMAILAGGVDRYYPSAHEALIGRIAERGAVVSELPPGMQPNKWRMLQRNRLMAAMADATIVIEAGWRSGALNIGGHASALGLPLGAVPGPINSAASMGCHRLLRDFEAVCTTTTEEAYLLAYPDGDNDNDEGDNDD